MDQFALKNQQRKSIKEFNIFEMAIKQVREMIGSKYGCVYKNSLKIAMKGSRIEIIEKARKEFKELLDEGCKKTSIFYYYF